MSNEKYIYTDPAGGGSWQYEPTGDGQKIIGGGITLDNTTPVAGQLTATTLKLGSTTLSEAELGVLDGVTGGTVAASKALIGDANGSFASSIFSNWSTFNGGMLCAKHSVITSSAVAISNSSGSALTQTIKRDLTGMTDNTATTVATITITNQQNAATFEILVTGYLGAGGAVGAGEAMASNKYIVSVVRTAGQATVASISSAFGAAAANVAGAATCTAVVTLGAVSGNNDATQTIAIQVTVTKSGGSSASHVAKTVITCTQHQATSGITCT